MGKSKTLPLPLGTASALERLPGAWATLKREPTYGRSVLTPVRPGVASIYALGASAATGTAI